MTAAASRRHILLLGNGLNRLANPLSWRQLLRRLDTPGAFSSVEPDLPFPFLFEAILHRREGENVLMEMKQEVEESVRTMSESRLHARVRALPVHHFLTTNYDYLLENHAGAPMTVRKGMGASTKRTYDSLFRYRSLPDGRRVWHIHGEANQPASILLGFKHYTNSVQSLDRYLEWVNPRKEQHNRGRSWNHRDARSPCRNASSALNRRVVAAAEDQWSWVDHFLTSTVHVLGLELDTSETLLWRLLMYRCQKLAEGRKWHTTQQVSPPIHFYTPPATTNRQKAHRTLLEAFGIRVHPFRIELQANGEFDYRTFYEQALEHIEAELA